MTIDRYVYGAIIRPSDEGGYWAEVPDLDGCYGQGDDYMDCIRSVADGIETHLAALAEYGMPIPPAGPVVSDDGEVVYVTADPGSVRLQVPTVSAAEAARMLNVSPGRVSQLIRDGRLVAERTAEGTNVTIDSIEAYRGGASATGRPRNATLATA